MLKNDLIKFLLQVLGAVLEVSVPFQELPESFDQETEPDLRSAHTLEEMTSADKEGSFHESEDVGEDICDDIGEDVGEDNEDEVDGTNDSIQTTDVVGSPHYQDGILSIASIVAHRLKDPHPDLVGDPSNEEQPILPEWLQSHATTTSIQPSVIMKKAALNLDSTFILQHGKISVDKEPGVLRRFTDQVSTQFPEIPW